MSRSVMDEIKDEVEGNPIVLYMKGTKDFPQCGFSAATVEVLKGHGIPLEQIYYDKFS